MSTLADRWQIPRQTIHMRVKAEEVETMTRALQTFIPVTIAQKWEKKLVGELRPKLKRLQTAAKNINASSLAPEIEA